MLICVCLRILASSRIPRYDLGRQIPYFWCGSVTRAHWRKGFASGVVAALALLSRARLIAGWGSKWLGLGRGATGRFCSAEERGQPSDPNGRLRRAGPRGLGQDVFYARPSCFQLSDRSRPTWVMEKAAQACFVAWRPHRSVDRAPFRI
jgi:hypothetical protein